VSALSTQHARSMGVVTQFDGEGVVSVSRLVVRFGEWAVGPTSKVQSPKLGSEVGLTLIFLKSFLRGGDVDFRKLAAGWELERLILGLGR
jgi:hypothetical protein